MSSLSLLDNRFHELNKLQITDCYRLEVNKQGQLTAFDYGQGSRGERDFSKVHAAFTAFVETLPQDLTIQQKSNLRFNIIKWNEKVDSHNQSVDRSGFLRILNKILEFISCSAWSLKGKHIDLNKVPKAEWDAKDDTPIGKWIAKHHGDFVAHAINDKNVSSVLSDGALRPAAEVLRTKGSVLKETSLGSYGKVEALDPKEMEKRIGNNKDQLELLWKKLIHMEMGEDHFPRVTCNNLDRSEFWRLSNEDTEFYDALKIHHDMKFPYVEQITKVYEKFMEHSKTIPKINERKFYLRNCWEKLQPVYDFLSAFKRTICSSIRTVENGIAWGYGKVVALRGNATPIIGGRMMGGSVINHETCLLEPYQNNGKYFSWDLRQKDTLILGPKVILEPYQKQYPNLHYIEDLTPAQRAFFIPQ